MRRLLAVLIVAALCLAVDRVVHAVVSDTVVQTISNYGNNATVNYTISFPFQRNSDIVVYLQDETLSTATRTLLQYGGGASEYTITGGDPGTTVVMGTAPNTHQKVVIQRSTPLTQPVEYNENYPFPFDDHEEQMDRNILIIQELNRLVGTRIGLSTASSATVPTFPDPWEDRFLLYNHAGTDLTLAPRNPGPVLGDVLRYSGATYGWSTYPLDSVINSIVGGSTVLSHTNLLDIGVSTHPQIDSHIANTSNPHAVTPAQVQNSNALWNAKWIKDKLVDDSAISSGKFLYFNGTDIAYSSVSQGGVTSHLSLTDIGVSTHAQIDSHIGDYNNPHRTTFSQLGASSLDITGVIGASAIAWGQVNKAGASLADIPSKSHTLLSDIGTSTHAQIDSHILNMSNPHNVTATQVGNDTAQWNANKLQNIPVSNSSLANGSFLYYNGSQLGYSSITQGGGAVGSSTPGDIKIKEGVVVVATTNITLSGEQIIDDILTDYSRVLVQSQTAAAENGIYVSSPGAWTRATDADTIDELFGAVVNVVGSASGAGTTYHQTYWVSQQSTGDVLGVSDIRFLQLTQNPFWTGATGVQRVNSTGRLSYGNIVNGDVSGSAAVARSKLGLGTANQVVVNSATGAFSGENQLALSRGGFGKNFTNATGATYVQGGASFASTLPVNMGGTGATAVSTAAMNLTPSTVTMGADEVLIDWALSNSFRKVQRNNVSTDFAFRNQGDGQALVFGLSTAGGNGVPIIKFPSGSAASSVHWSTPGNAAPQPVPNKMNVYTFMRLGDSTFGTVIQGFN